MVVVVVVVVVVIVQEIKVAQADTLQKQSDFLRSCLNRATSALRETLHENEI